MALETTYGGQNAEAYISVADADVIATTEILQSEAWLAVADTVKEIALRMASRHIDSYNYEGDRYFYNQGLLFPRVPNNINFYYQPYSGMGAADVFFINFLERDEYLRKQKNRVRRACVIQACHVLRTSGRIPEREAQFKGVGSRSGSRAGVSDSQSYVASAHRLCPEAMDEMRHYYASPRLVRGSGPGLVYKD